MKISQDFYWEMSHRLPWHEGLCKNIHGHSYKMQVMLYGDLDENQIIVDYYDIFKVVKPYIDKLDHCFLCESDDELMITFLKTNDFKHLVIQGKATAENICNWFLEELRPQFAKYDNIHKLAIRIFETEDTYAENKIKL